MQVGLLYKIYILLFSALYTLSLSVKCIFAKIFFSPDNRQIYITKISRKWAKNLLQLVKVNLVVHDPYKVTPEPNKKYLIMCNHNSLYDIPISVAAITNFKLRMIAKKELSKIPFFGLALKYSETPLIDRNNREKAKESLEHAKRVIEKGITIWIAPEGTRSKDGKLLPLKLGGFKLAVNSDANIVPAFISGSHKILPAKTTNFSINQTVHVHIGKPISHEIDKPHKLKSLKEAVMKEWNKHVHEND